MNRTMLLFAELTRKNNCSEVEKNSSDSDKCFSTLPQVAASEQQIQNALSIVFGVIAAVAIIVIILGAINLATAEGNPEGISKAKKTIIYALLGLIIALSAEALVLTLLGKL